MSIPSDADSTGATPPDTRGLATSARVISSLRGRLIVSCQPAAPLDLPDYVARLAMAMVEEGAAGLRIEGAERIAAVRAAVPVPILGILKRRDTGFDAYITPTLADIDAVIDAGASIVALDGRDVTRPDGATVRQLVERAHSRGVPVMADISAVSEGVAAARAGADMVATTLSGYTPASPPGPAPDFTLIERLIASVDVPVVAEGRLNRPADMRKAFELGAHAVVVGRAITEPRFAIQQFLAALPGSAEEQD